jgi:hypothetical protein
MLPRAATVATVCRYNARPSRGPQTLADVCWPSLSVVLSDSGAWSQGPGWQQTTLGPVCYWFLSVFASRLRPSHSRVFLPGQRQWLRSHGDGGLLCRLLADF